LDSETNPKTGMEEIDGFFKNVSESEIIVKERMM
jgi:hypothetical protein